MLAVLLTAAAIPAQQKYAAGYRDLVWPNQTGLGSPLLFTRVVYPSLVGGAAAPLHPQAGGWPVIVFLHGYGQLGRDYAELGERWVSRGFVVVQVDSAMFSYFDLVYDGWAQFGAIAAANSAPGGFFAGAFDLARIGLAGHSMGGGAMAMILGANPGYRCGFAMAPAWPGSAYTSMVHVPMGVLVGDGDLITPSSLHAQPYFQSLDPASGLKFSYRFDANCDHMNLVGLGAPTASSFRLCASIGIGFFEHFLDVDGNGLDACLGPAVVQDPNVVAFDCQVTEPQLWAEAPLQLGQTVRISLAAEVGLGGILAAPSLGSGLATSLGLLRLDPVTCFTWATGMATPQHRLDVMLSVPNDPNLVGATIAFQGIGGAVSHPLLLGSATSLRIRP